MTQVQGLGTPPGPVNPVWQLVGTLPLQELDYVPVLNVSLGSKIWPSEYLLELWLRQDL